MLFFYIRHGDPIYDPDSLTPLGERQAEAVAKRLSLYGIDKIYSSSSNRAIRTATPTAQILKKDIETLDFANESYAWEEFTVKTEAGKRWFFQHPQTRRALLSDEIRALRFDWHTHPYFKGTPAASGSERILSEADAFFAALGYRHLGRTGRYSIENPRYERVALFAHQGFGLAFLSSILDIPFPEFATRFDFCHTGMTVIDFADEGDGICIPKVLTFSSDSHIYKEGLPTKYQNLIYF